MTIPIPFTTQPETRAGFPCEAFRWSFQFYRWGAGFFHQHKHKDSPEWGTSHTAVWAVSFRLCGWGVDHIWYDGPHCGARFGFVSVQWDNPWGCRKCGGEG